MSIDPKTHTPGPWSLDRFGKVITPHGNLLATGIALPCGNHPDAKEAEANTRLIAAAPDLLEACQDFVSKVRDYQAGRINLRLDDFCERAITAITKAHKVP